MSVLKQFYKSAHWNEHLGTVVVVSLIFIALGATWELPAIVVAYWLFWQGMSLIWRSYRTERTPSDENTFLSSDLD